MIKATSSTHAASDDARRVNLLICDDSVFMRMAIRTLCEEDPRIVVVGEAKNGSEAIEAVRTLKPDVVTMDVDMPGVDGASATEQIVRDTDIPIIMLSGINRSRSALTNHLLDNGAVDVIWKSASMMDIDIGGVAQTIIEKVLFWGQKPANEGPYAVNDDGLEPHDHDVSLISVGAGGPHAIAKAFGPPGADSAPMIVVADIPMACMDGFLRHLNRITGLTVTIAAEGMALQRDSIYVIPGAARMRISVEDQQMIVRSDSTAAQLPNSSVFVTLQLMLAAAGKTALIVLMSGGRPSTQALKLSASKGCCILVQAPESCVSSSGFGETLKEIGTAREASPEEIKRILSQAT